MAESKSPKARRYAIGFSAVGSLVTILFFAFINFYTGVRFPWFVFPSYAVLWWPLALIFGGRSSGKILSLIGSAITIALLFLINYLTSWSSPWFLYPAFAILFWPLSMFFAAGHPKVYSLAGTAALIAFFVLANFLTSRFYIWFCYPAFAVIWWPLSVFFAKPATMKLYSSLGALLLIAFVTVVNLTQSPFCPWALFVVFPALMWPAAVFLGRRAGKLIAASICAALGIAYYAALNLTVFRGFPWAVFPTFTLLWWPLSVALTKRGRALSLALAGSVLSAAFFIAVNLMTTPGLIWAVYPIFALVWWPLSVYFFVYRLKKEPARQGC